MPNPVYTVGWICAIIPEYVAAQAFLDEKHAGPESFPAHDNNDYTLGRIGQHNVVIAVLPNGEYGISTAANVARDMLRSFPHIRIGLMVGVGGGVPSPKHDIRLGDVVVSAPRDGHGGPPSVLRGAMSGLEAQYESEGHQLAVAIDKVLEKKTRLRRKYGRPDRTSDRLYRSGVVHLNDETSCALFCGDDSSTLISRPERTENEDDPAIHYGLIASANRLMKDALVRDRLAAEKDVMFLTKRGHDKDHQLIADWLTSIDYALQQSDFFIRRQEGTGEWFLQSSEFQQWLKEKNQTLFCRGMPGAGKTILTSIVIQHLHNTFRHDPTCGIAYLFCNFRQQYEQKSTDLVLSLLKQLVQEQPSMPEIVKDLYNNYKLKRTRPPSDEVFEALRSVIKSYSRVFIIVDALDECQNSSEGRKMFLSNVSKLQAKTGLNFFATSRFMQEIEKEFKGNIMIEIRARDTDVQNFLEGKMQAFRSLVTKDRPLQEEIKKRIAKAVDGMFLLAQLYVDSLAHKTTPKAIRNALNELEIESEAPNSDTKVKVLDCAYTHAMERINVQATELQELAKHVLSWITCARRPLTSLELQHALAVELDEPELDTENIPDIDDMVSVRAGLVVIDEKSDVIRLVHYTMQEYFERTRCSWFPSAHTDITKTCIAYLSIDAFKTGSCLTMQELKARWKAHVLYDYAARNWGHHARESSMHDVNRLILEFLETETRVSARVQALLTSKLRLRLQRVPKPIRALHLAAYFGLEKTVAALLTAQNDPDTKDGGRMTPLYWAARMGHEAIARLLLDSGADPGPIDENDDTPLHCAARMGHEATAKLLLERGADPNIELRVGKTLLHWAAKHGKWEVVKLLLEKGAYPDVQAWNGRAPLHEATRKGDIVVVNLLIQQGANPGPQDECGEAPLHLAARENHHAIIRLLLEKGVHPGPQYINGQTPLHWAAYNGHETAVQLLLESGADLSPRDVFRRTPVYYAADRGHKAVVKPLLEKGAIFDFKDIKKISDSEE
ncbi:hypothetical protein FE257_007045 [Aspergillus nanangensis]|uniref:NACHT domain-containing protein n=1 Tax=Aspergillus nanangensis TaxID=2582783 RepID=A0AAD4GTN2_ASPNN|nr:hypothetical protein FE257_007045 [Aspergillus nanangensis]